MNAELSNDIREMMETIPNANIGGYMFTSKTDASVPWYPETLNKRLQRARESVPSFTDDRGRSDVPLPPSVPISFRRLRIFCASQLFAADKDIRSAKAVLGHASLATTDRYYVAFTEQQLRDATVGVGDELNRKVFRGMEY
jgi:integrase